MFHRLPACLTKTWQLLLLSQGNSHIMFGARRNVITTYLTPEIHCLGRVRGQLWCGMVTIPSFYLLFLHCRLHNVQWNRNDSNYQAAGNGWYSLRGVRDKWRVSCHVKRLRQANFSFWDKSLPPAPRISQFPSSTPEYSLWTVQVLTWLNYTVGVGRALFLYGGDACFKSLTCHQLSWLKILVVFLSAPGMPEQCLV